MRRALLLGLGVTGLLAGVVIAQQPSPPPAPSQEPAVTFRTEINYVEINASVADQAGNFVRDLSKDDFQVYEDGRLQTPSVFALVDLPVERPFVPVNATQPIEPDVRATTRNFDGRLFVIVLDDLHTTTVRTSAVQQAARRFIEESVGVNDLAAVVYASGRPEAAQELTASRRLLLAAVDKFQGRKLPSAASERSDAFIRERNARAQEEQQQQDGQRRRIDDPLDAERGYNARQSLRIVKNIADGMADIRGRRKALVVFSEGVDYDISDVFNNRSATDIMSEAREAVAAAQRANVSIYAIDARGLVAISDEAIEVAVQPANPSLGLGSSAFQRELVLGQDSLRTLAEQTGGFAVLNTNDVAGGITRIVRDNSLYYVLGYYSDPTRSPARFRKIEVRVKRPGLEVRARRGYMPPDPKAVARAREVAAKADASPALDAALGNPLPIGSLPMRVFAAPFKGPGRNASVMVAVEIDSSGLKFEERDDRFYENIELSIVASDQEGKIRGGDRQKFELRLRAQTHELLSRTGVRILSRFELPPSRYQFRVGAHESVGGAVGTVPYDLEVPDYSRIPFTLSGLVLTSSEAGRLMTSRPDPLLKDVFPMPPVATRVFDRESTIAFFVELYDASSPASHTVDLVATVRAADDGRVVFNMRDERGIEASSQPRIHGYQGEVPLQEFTPGMYVLRVEATSRVQNQAVSREVLFEVAR